MSLKKMFYVLIGILLLPTVVFAKDYNLDENITVTLDDTEWYVFTRDNIKGNPELEELGVDEEYLTSFFETNKVYVDAILYFDDGENYIEFFVRRNESSGTDDLTSKNDSYVLTLTEQMAELQGSKDYDIYKTDYKFGRLKYVDLGLYLDEFFTIYDGYAYTFTFQATENYDSYDTARVISIMESIKFDGEVKNTTNEVEENEEDKEDEEKSESVLDGAIRGAIIGGITGAVVAAVVALTKKKKNDDSSLTGL